MIAIRWLAAALCVAAPLTASAQPRQPRSDPRSEPRSVSDTDLPEIGVRHQLRFRVPFLDKQGVVRWKDDNSEVTLFGANYVLPSASDYRAAGYLGLDRKKMIDEDMAHFARMGWDGLRLTFWGDWESSDVEGNLIANDHLDLLDYLIAKARERGIYMLFSPIQTYDAGWPDAMGDSVFPGFSKTYGRGDLGTKPAAIAAQARYLKQVLEHVNPYTKTALKDEPSIVFIELVNEPWHHGEDVPGSVSYINALADAVRSTGCTKLLFYNVSQDFAILESIRKSKVPGLTFGWYPTGLNSGHTLQGNYLRTVDAYPDMLRPEMAGMPRIVYEFDSADLQTGYMYPAMIRAFRTGGVQLAAMFAYDMLGTASRNLGWQTHHLNLVYTPRKAMSAMIAAEAMRRLPRGKSYGAYPTNTRFGDFRVSYEEDLSELVSRDAFLHAGTTRSTPPDVASLTRLAGVGSSPVVSYDGTGTWFLDKLGTGLWRLEVYPDVVPLSDPFAAPNRLKVVTALEYGDRTILVRLPELGESFSAFPLGSAGGEPIRAARGAVTLRPGVYVLSANGTLDRGALPARVGHLGIDEYHAPPSDRPPFLLESRTASEQIAGRPLELAAQLVSAEPPDSVVASDRPVGGAMWHRYPMRVDLRGGLRASVPAADAPEGAYEYVVTYFREQLAQTFPEAVSGEPRRWDYTGTAGWRLRVVSSNTPIRLFAPAEDAPMMAFSRIGDAGRRGLFRVVTSARTGEPAFHFELPVVNGWSPDDYTGSLVVKDRVAARGETVAQARGLRLRLRGVGPRQTVHVTLVERDGTAWSKALAVDSTWDERFVPLSELTVARAVKLPLGFPGEWNYWIEPAEGRGGAGDRPKLDQVERLQISLRNADAGAPGAPRGVEIESVALVFDGPGSG